MTVLLQSQIRCCDKLGHCRAWPGRRARRLVPQRTVGDWRPSFGACPCLRSSGTGTAADGGASPLASARRSRDAALRFRYEPSREKGPLSSRDCGVTSSFVNLLSTSLLSYCQSAQTRSGFRNFIHAGIPLTCAV